MKQYLLLICAVLFTLNSFAQISFESGYIINNKDEKITCLIKNLDWKNTPSKFEYKLTETSEKQIGSLKNIKEFGIYNISKYIRSQVQIDRSSDDINELDNIKKPKLKEETLFLKVLVDGESSLYSYTDGNFNRYFFNTKNTPIEQFLYKVYLTSGNRITYNKSYKTQLFKNFNCSDLAFAEIDNVNYTKQSFVNFFIKYSKCTNVNFTNFAKKQKKDRFNLSIRAGVKYSTLDIEYYSSSARNTDFGGQLSARTGFELEFIMPFNKNKWAVIIEPTYQSFKSEKETTFWALTTNYQSIEVPFGIRHYFFLNDKSKIFVDAAYVIDTDLNSAINTDLGGLLPVSTRNNLALGLGFNYNNKFSLQLRTQSRREILNSLSLWSSDYRSSSIVIGYSIL